jgi:hypothetical protein
LLLANGFAQLHLQQVELSCPGDESRRRLLSCFIGARTLELMQDFVAGVDPRTSLMLAEKSDCVGKRTDDAAISQLQRWP